MTEPEFELLEDDAASSAVTGRGGTRPLRGLRDVSDPWRLAAAAVVLAAVAAVAGFAAGRWSVHQPAPARVTATPPARFDHVFSWDGFRNAWPGPAVPPTSGHPFSDVGVARLTKVLDPDSGRLVDATWAAVQAPASDDVVHVLAVRPLTVDGHDAVQVDLTGRQTAQVVVGAYGEQELSLDSTVVTRVTRIEVDGEVWDVWGNVRDGTALPEPGSVGAADYEEMVASVAVH